MFQLNEKFLDELDLIQCIVHTLKEYSELKEICSIYYGLESQHSRALSQERNNSINLLNIAIEKIENLKTY